MLSGCVTTPPAVNYNYSYVESTGAWKTREIEDELDGNWRRSYVFTEKASWIDTNPGIFVDTYANGNTSLFFTNGDGYICDTGTLKVRVKFDDWEVYSLDRFYGEFKLSNNSSRIVLFDTPYNSNSAKSDFLEKLAKYKKVVIETQDSCGTIKQMKFNIEGNPHYIAKRIGPIL